MKMRQQITTSPSLAPTRLTISLLVLAVQALLLQPSTEAATLTVGATGPYQSLTAAHTAAAPGDTILVSSITLTENVTITKPGLTIQASPSSAPEIIGRLSITASNTTLRGLTIRNWTNAGTHGVSALSTSGLTVESCRIYNGSSGSAAIYLRNSSKALLRSNLLYKCGAGIQIISGRSPAATYENGTRIIANDIHDNDFDGIDLHGVYLTVEGNYIWNNIATNWAATHPDGIQLIDSAADGQSGAQNVRISSNRIKNHTQNVFTAYYCTNIHVWNNVMWMDEGFVNGVNLDTIATKNIICAGGSDIHIYNNTLGRASNTGIFLYYVSSEPPMKARIHNNLITGIFGGGAGVWVQNTRDVTSLNNNLYFGNSNDLRWQNTYYSTISQFAAAQPSFEQAAVSANPQMGPMPNPTIPGTSPAVRKGLILDSLYQYDIVGNQRSPLNAWDLGAFSAGNPPAAPANFRLE